MEPTQPKTISIIDLSSKNISYVDKQTQQPKVFTNYLLKASDGYTYESSDQAYFLQRKIGETLNINFFVKTTRSPYGKLFTHYVIVPDRTPAPIPQNQVSKTVNPPQNQQGDKMKAIMDRIGLMEENIIAAIRLHKGDNIDVEEEVDPVNFEIAEANKEKNNDIPVIEESQIDNDISF